MEIGDKVKVVRIDDYTRSILEVDNHPLPIGMVGEIVDKYYNHNMKRMEVIVDHQGDRYIWEEWNLFIL